MTREQLLATLVVLSVLTTAVAQFYSLKAEVFELRLKLDYLAGAGWHVPEAK